MLPKRYTATATIVYDPTANALTTTQDATAEQRQLATISSLITTPHVLDAVAGQVGISERKLEKQVKASVDATANLITVTGTAGTADKAAQIANAAARAFIAQQRSRRPPAACRRARRRCSAS